MNPALRLALVGAFRFPFVQGSQAYVAEQAQALVEAGAEVAVASYGPGPDADAAAANSGRGPADVPAPGWETIAIQPGLAPRSARSGPGIAKPRADFALARRLAEADRARPFDAVLAHNVEAVATVRLARSLFGLRTPAVYVAHTLWEHETTAYVPPAASAWPVWPRLGRRLDAWAARTCVAVLTLCETATVALAPHSCGPLACIPPGLRERPAPSAAAVEAACARLGLKRGRFVLYSGNVDAYQDLDGLACAARALRGDERLVIATHDPRGAPSSLAATANAAIVIHEVSDEAEARSLRFAAAVHVVPRARPGGFPIKLLNAMESGRPIVAHHGVADTLADERSALLIDRGAGTETGRALRRLLDDPALGERLARGALGALREHHHWPEAARRTLALTERVVTPLRRPAQASLHPGPGAAGA